MLPVKVSQQQKWGRVSRWVKHLLCITVRAWQVCVSPQFWGGQRTNSFKAVLWPPHVICGVWAPARTAHTLILSACTSCTCVYSPPSFLLSFFLSVSKTKHQNSYELIATACQVLFKALKIRTKYLQMPVYMNLASWWDEGRSEGVREEGSGVSE